MHAATVAFILFAASQVIAAPTSANNARSITAIGNAIGNLAEDVLGPGSPRRDVNTRSLSAIENFLGNLRRDEVDARSLSAIENFLGNLKRGEDVDARSLSAIENFIGNLKRDELDTRSLSAIENFFSNLKRDDRDARSLSAIENFISNLKRSDDIDARSLSAIEGVVNDIFSKRSLKAVGTAVAGGIASGIAGAVGNAVLNNKRSEPSGLMVDTETGTLYMDVPDTNDGRSLKAVGAAVAGGVASGVAGAVGNAVLNNKRASSGVMVDTDTGVIYMDVPDANQGRSLKAVGTAVAGGIASGIAGAVGNAVLNNKRSDSGVMVDTDTGVIYMDVPDTQGARSLKAVGTAIAGGVASLATGAVANDVLGNNKRSLSAIENFISNLKREELDARSLSAIENFLGNLKRTELEESMARRSINDLE